MIYSFGCSVTKWYWPTWSDWLSVYRGPVTNLAFKGYGNDNIYWTLFNNIDRINVDDEVYIMWTQNHRMCSWYDQEYISNKDILGFFPVTDGKLWFTDNQPYRGMYRTHPDYQPSLTHMIINQLQTIFNAQLLLEKQKCKYKMMFVHNPFLDCRPTYSPQFEFVWHKKEIISPEEQEFANCLFEIKEVKKLVNAIDWNRFIYKPANPTAAISYSGMWEFFFNKKEYLIYSHDSDPHPVSLTHHDFALQNILNQDPKKGKFRQVATEISKNAMNMPIPNFSEQDYVGTAETILLDQQFEKILNELSRS
jgi:hypothetical protein